MIVRQSGNTEEFGTPVFPTDLIKKQSLKVGWQSASNNWSLRQHDGTELILPSNPVLCSDDMSTLKQTATEGFGIVALPAYTCKAELNAGQLVRILPEWTAGAAQLSLIAPAIKWMPPQAMLLEDYLINHLHDDVTP